MERLKKLQEQQDIIERQRLQIEHLQQQPSPQTLKTPSKPTHRTTNSMNLDFSSPIDVESISKLQRRANSLDRSRSRSHYYVVDDDGTDEEFHDEYDGNAVQGHSYNPGNVMSAMTAPPGQMGQFEQEPTVIGASFTGQEGTQYPMYQQQQQTPQRPLLSDNAIKMISGVVVVLGALWIVNKWLSSDSKSTRGAMPKILKRAPRVRY